MIEWQEFVLEVSDRPVGVTSSEVVGRYNGSTFSLTCCDPIGKVEHSGISAGNWLEPMCPNDQLGTRSRSEKELASAYRCKVAVSVVTVLGDQQCTVVSSVQLDPAHLWDISRVHPSRYQKKDDRRMIESFKSTNTTQNLPNSPPGH